MERSGLSVTQGVALMLGAVLGTGVLSLPGLAAEAAGPASLVAWGLLVLLSVPLAVTFAALGGRFPDGGGVSTYARRAFGARAATVVGWCFFFAVPVGAPPAAGFAGAYVADAAGGGRSTQLVTAGVLIVLVAAMNYAGIRVSATVQLGVAAVLAAPARGRHARGAAARPARPADPVRAVRVGVGRHRGRAPGLGVRRVGGGLVAVGGLPGPGTRHPAGDRRRRGRDRAALPGRRVRDGDRPRHRRRAGAALRPAGDRAGGVGPAGHHGRRGAALGGRDERLLRRVRPARGGAGPRRLAARVVRARLRTGRGPAAGAARGHRRQPGHARW